MPTTFSGKRRQRWTLSALSSWILVYGTVILQNKRSLVKPTLQLALTRFVVAVSHRSSGTQTESASNQSGRQDRHKRFAS